jgi:hypothetical protein
MELKKIKVILEDVKSHSNKDLVESMDFLISEHEKTKESLFKLTHNLDLLEKSYNKILEEYKTRVK